MKETIKSFLLKKDYSLKEIKILLLLNKILINNTISTNLLDKVDLSKDKIIIKDEKKWVSRGAYKLLAAIESFHINFKQKIILDIGASTGGFTEVALHHQAKKVYALDVGYNQLDYKLRINPKVVNLEKHNLKNIKHNLFAEKIDIILADVAFISLYHVFKVTKELNFNKMIILIKPQFEAKRNQIEKGGIVNLKFHQEIINNIIEKASLFKLKIFKIIKSPIKGLKSKNIEYLALVKKDKNYE